MVTKDIARILDALDGLALPREAECVCGAVVLVQPDGRRTKRDGATAHVCASYHKPAAPRRG